VPHRLRNQNRPSHVLHSAAHSLWEEEGRRHACPTASATRAGLHTSSIALPTVSGRNRAAAHDRAMATVEARMGFGEGGAKAGKA